MRCLVVIYILCIELRLLMQMWKLDTGAPVFSSPCVAAISVTAIREIIQHCHICSEGDGDAREVIMVGSHSCRGYCICPHGQLLWYCQADGPIYATPFAVQASCECSKGDVQGDFPIVCFVSSVGIIYIVKSADGTVLTQYQLPGEVFSSPVIKDGRILLVGCRDDHLYGLKLG